MHDGRQAYRSRSARERGASATGRRWTPEGERERQGEGLAPAPAGALVRDAVSARARRGTRASMPWRQWAAAALAAMLVAAGVACSPNDPPGGSGPVLDRHGRLRRRLPGARRRARRADDGRAADAPTTAETTSASVDNLILVAGRESDIAFSSRTPRSTPSRAARASTSRSTCARSRRSTRTSRRSPPWPTRGSRRSRI